MRLNLISSAFAASVCIAACCNSTATGGTDGGASAGSSGSSGGSGSGGSTAGGSTASGSTASGSTASGSTASGSTASGSTASGSTASGSTASGSTASGSTASGSTASGSTASGSTASGSTASGSSSSSGSGSSGAADGGNCAQALAPWDGGSPSIYCTDAGWCDQVDNWAYGSGAVWGSVAGDVYAVDSLSTLRHYDGNTWSIAAATNPITDLYDQIQAPIGGSGPNDIWASSNLVYTTGSLGTGMVLHWDGSNWTPVVLPSGDYPPSSDAGNFWASGPSDAYLTAEIGGLLHWDGCSWSTTAATGPYSFAAVWGSGPSDVWASGLNNSGANAQVAHFDGTTWTTQDTGVILGITAIWGSGPKDVFAVGDDPTYTTVGTIIHYDGTGWTQMTVPMPTNFAPTNPAALEAVWGSGPTDVWAFGSNEIGLGDIAIIAHYDGTTWTLRSDLPVYISGAESANYGIYSAWGSATNDVWAVGGNGEILHFDGTAWSYWNDGVDVTYTVNGIWGSDSRSDAWAVETNDYYALRLNHWDGKAWAPVENFVADPTTGYPTYYGHGIGGSASSDVWVVGGQVTETSTQGQSSHGWALHYDGGVWEDYTSVLPAAVPQNGTNHSPQLFAVSAHAATDAWAVGEASTTLQWNGTAWTAQPNPLYDPTGNNPGPPLNAVYDFGSDVYAAGPPTSTGAASMMHYTTGGAWVQEAMPKDAMGNFPIVYALWGVSPTDVWAAGRSIFHRNATGWSLVTATLNSQLSAVWGSATDDVWFADSENQMEHWDGTAISSVPASALGHNLQMNALWGDANGYWAAGGSSYYRLQP